MRTCGICVHYMDCSAFLLLCLGAAQLECCPASAGRADTGTWRRPSLQARSRWCLRPCPALSACRPASRAGPAPCWRWASVVTQMSMRRAPQLALCLKCCYPRCRIRLTTLLTALRSLLVCSRVSRRITREFVIPFHASSCCPAETCRVCGHTGKSSTCRVTYACCLA